MLGPGLHVLLKPPTCLYCLARTTSRPGRPSAKEVVRRDTRQTIGSSDTRRCTSRCVTGRARQRGNGLALLPEASTFRRQKRSFLWVLFALRPVCSSELYDLKQRLTFCERRKLLVLLDLKTRQFPERLEPQIRCC